MQLDPDAATVLEMIRTSGRPPWHTLSPDGARASYMAGRQVTAPEPMPVAEVRDLSAPGPHGPIPLRLYRPASAPGQGAGALVFFHGGGWVLGNIESHDGVCRHLAERSGCVVVSVDYRLAPEHKFPAALDDACAATAWVASQAAALGLDAARIAVGGDSAGGNLAAAACIAARLRQGMASYTTNAQGFGLTRDAMAHYRALYVPEAAQWTDWRASPLLANDHRGLPPALVLTAGFDPLRDAGRAYADALSAAGVPTQFVCFERQIHGFFSMSRLIDEASLAVALCGSALRRAWAQ